MARILPGSILHLNAARAANGIGAGSNSAPTSEWYDLSGQGHHGTLTGFGYEEGDRPRTNVETDKAIWHDQSGNGNDGTLTNFAYTEASGWATVPDRLVLDGTDYVVLPDLSLAEDLVFAYEAWVATTTGSLGFISEGNGAGGASIVFTCSSTGQLRLTMKNDAATQLNKTSTSTTTILNGALHQIVASCDGANVQFYFDGATLDAPIALLTGTYTLTVATLGALRTNAVNSLIIGALYAARLYSQDVSAAEVAQNYATGATGEDYSREGLALAMVAARAVRPSGWVDL